MVLAIDTETGLIQNGLLAPPPACLSWSDGRRAEVVPSVDRWAHMRAFAERALLGSIVGFNVAFDMAVLLAWIPELAPLIFRAYHEGRIHDIQVLERLGQIATAQPTRYYDSLADCAIRYHVKPLEKNDGVRTSYAPLIFKSLSEYSPRQIEYSADDASATWHVYRRARARYRDAVTDEAISQETRHAFWLHLVSCWGLRTDPDRVEELRRSCAEVQSRLQAIARAAGFIRPDGTENASFLRQYVGHVSGARGFWARVGESRSRCTVRWEFDQDSIPENLRTRKKKPWTIKKDHVAKMDSGDPLLESLAEFGVVNATMNGQVPMLEAATRMPLHSRFKLADTTRTTSSAFEGAAGGNVQNAARNLDDKPYLRVREAYEPRPGNCFGDCDVVGLEAATFAQVLIWTCNRWEFARKLNAGLDFHVELASVSMGIGYEQGIALKKAKDPTMKEERQFAKIPNYGKLGGMGWRTLIKYARGQGIKMDPEKAQRLDSIWQRLNPDALFYQKAYIPTLERGGRYDFQIPGSPGIWRRGATFTSACNGHFQGLGAQVMKRIGWALTLEAWTDPSSPLHVSRGARMSNFVHDSVFYEIPIGAQHEVLERVATVMRAGLAHGLPDLKTDVDYMAMSRWTKGAEAIWNNGRLGIWEPEK